MSRPVLSIMISRTVLGSAKTGASETPRLFRHFFQALLFAAVGEKAVIADAHQAFGKRVEEKSSDEFHRLDSHGLDGSLLAVLVREGDLSVGKIENPAIGDRDPVRVAGRRSR